MKLSNKVYDILKAIALIWLPAIGTLYFALAGIWNPLTPRSSLAPSLPLTRSSARCWAYPRQTTTNSSPRTGFPFNSPCFGGGKSCIKEV